MDNEDLEQEQISSQKLGETVTRGGLDYATGGAWEVARRAPVVGKAARGIENKAGKIVSKPMGHYGGKMAKKLDDSGAIDAANKGMDVAGGNMQQSKTGLKKDNFNKNHDVGANNLKKANSNRGLNNLFSRNKNKKDETSNDGNNNSQENSNSEGSNELEGVVKKARKVKLIIGIAASLFPILLIVVVLVAVVASVMAPVQSVYKFLFPMSDEEFDEIQQNVYYSELLNEGYKEKYNALGCGEELNINLIHAAVIYRYYISGEEPDAAGYNGMLNQLDYWARDDIIGNTPSKCIDFSRNGEYYNHLKGSAGYSTGGTFGGYYNDIIVQEVEESIKNGTNKSRDDIIEEILDGIYDLAEMVSVIKDTPKQEAVISDSAQVTTTKNIEMPFKSYVSGVVYANSNNSNLTDYEKIKALTIASTSNILAANDISLSTGNISLNNNTGLDYCSLSSGCSYSEGELVEGGGMGGGDNNTFSKGEYYYRAPLDTSSKNSIEQSVDNVYGKVLVDSKGNYVSVDLDKINNAKGSTFTEILKNAYGDVTIKNIRENVYVDGVNFGYEKVQTSVIAYEQTDYDNVAFCGLKHSIGEWGCGVTAMAMVLSTYENNKKYDPVYTMNKAYGWGKCGSGISGTAISYFKTQAQDMGYKYLNVGKWKTEDKNLVLSHLAQGHLVVVHVLKGTFTGGGHYMVLSGIDPANGKVYVTDPYNKKNKSYRNSGSGWYSFNDIIVPEAHSKYKPFHIIWKG